MNKSKTKTEPETTVPTGLKKALATAPKAKALWNGLTPIARRDFVTWIESAKQQETRDRRIEKACDMLVKGKRRPCCYALVPMNFYRALGNNQKAKAQWRELNPTERRDFVDWVDSVKDPKKQELQIKKACRILSVGKRHP